MEIISYKTAPLGAKYIAEIEVYHNRTYFRRIRLMVSQKGHHFINLPVYGEEDGQGGKKWVQFWEWPKSNDDEFKRQVIEAIQPYLNKGLDKEAQGPASPPKAPQTAYPSTFQPDLNDCPF